MGGDAQSTDAPRARPPTHDPTIKALYQVADALAAGKDPAMVLAHFDRLANIASKLTDLSSRARQCSTAVTTADNNLKVGACGSAFGDPNLDPAVRAIGARASGTVTDTAATLRAVADLLAALARLTTTARTTQGNDENGSATLLRELDRAPRGVGP
jgi:hypothetical protein